MNPVRIPIPRSAAVLAVAMWWLGAALSAQAATAWTEAEFEPVSSGIESPVRIAVRHAGNALGVAVEVQAVPGATVPPAVTLGVAAAGKMVLGPQTAAKTGRPGGWRAVFTVPPGGIAKTPAEWATLRLACAVVFDGGPYAQPLYRARYRHTDGRALHAPFSELPADWLPFDLAGYAQRVADRGVRVEIAFQQPLDGKATIVIEDAAGKRVRNLIGGAAYAKGAHAVEWDLLDDAGAPVAPGEYRWRSLHHAGIVPEYLFSYASGDADPPWRTGSGTDMWGPDHSCYTAVAAAGDRVWVQSPVSEAGVQGALLDLDGIKRQSTWAGSSGDKLLLAADDALFYAAADNGQRVAVRRRNVADFLPYGKELDVVVWQAPAGEDRTRRHENWAQVNWKEYNLCGFAVAGKLVLVALRETQSVIVLDAVTGEKRQEIPLQNPGALAGLPDGTWFAVSGGALLRFAPGQEKPVTIRAAGPLQPGAMTAGGDGRLYLVDEATQQIVILDATSGKEVGRLGKPGGPYAGQYDPARMVNPLALAVAGNGWLWVTEDRFNPKRVLAWDLKTARVAKEKFGSTAYGASGSGFDSEDTTRFVGLGCVWKVDLAAKTAHPSSVLFRDDAVMPQAMHWRFLRRDGRTFLLGFGACNSLVELQPDGSGKLLGRFGSAHLFCFEQRGHIPPVFLETFYTQGGYDTPEKRRTRLHDGRWPHNGEFFVWSDVNGDGAMQADELEFASCDAAGYWGVDAETLDIVCPVRIEGSGQGQAVMRLPLTGWHPSGAPRWRPLAERQSALTVIDPNRWWLNEAALTDRAGRLFVNADPLTAYSAAGQPLWTYPNHWHGVHGSHGAPLPKPGQLQGALFFLGNAPLPGGRDDVFVMNGNHGRFFVITSDGFYLDEMFRDVRSGAPVDAYFIGGEVFGGFFGRGSDGRYYLISGHTDYRIFRLDGFDSIVRGPGGTLKIAPQQIEAAERRAHTAAQSAAAPRRAKIPFIAAPPALDGKGTGWPDPAGVNWNKDGTLPVAVQAAWDDVNLYVRWSVEDPSPWKNGGDDENLLFKTGDSVDLQLGADPSALPNRTAPVPGDLRLLIAPFKGQPVAILYRHRVPGTKQPVPFSSPWRTENVDVVKRLASAKLNVAVGRNAAGTTGYIVEAAIPLAELGLKPAPGKAYRADFGVLYGDAAGLITGLRSYWSNQNTGLVNDVPGEIMLQPNAWGTVQFNREVKP
ncbi:MAG TPA: FlgD immunoglobulin-like domain containing protein [Phycisphaerae bacterium]|nr:FlgD immunoglobulin-like domain containing protein [Phycisphaerae bacterium]